MKRDRYIIGPALSREPQAWRCTKNGVVLCYEVSQRRALQIIPALCRYRWEEFGELSELQIKGVDGKVRDARTYPRSSDPRLTQG